MKAQVPVLVAVRALREFERRQLAFIRTIEDRDLLYEIGYHQAMGRPLSVKHLLLLGLGSLATVQRRLRHLRRAGAIRQRRSRADRRALELTLAPRIWRLFGSYSGTAGDGGSAARRASSATGS